MVGHTIPMTARGGTKTQGGGAFIPPELVFLDEG